MVRATLSLMLLVTATSSFADDGHHYIRTRWAEGDVAVQGLDASVDQVRQNVPILPNDRLHSEAGGRLELQTADGTLLQLDERSQLDYDDHRVDDASAELFVFRLESGSLYLHGALPSSNRYRVDTTHGSIEVASPGLLRVDTDRYETRLSVIEGEASLIGGGDETQVAAWQTAAVIRGRRPASVRALDAPNDAFAEWQAQRGTPDSRWPDALPGLPAMGWPCAQDLEAGGEWLWNASLRREVWRPFVDRDWQPFLLGRWYWAEDDWVWVADEPWGWLPYHFGTWRHSAELGWHWIPGSEWAPAWVEWAEGDEYVGWQPEGADISFNQTSWIFTYRADFRRRDISRCRFRPQQHQCDRALRAKHARLARSLHLTTAFRRTRIHKRVSLARLPSPHAKARVPRPRAEREPDGIQERRDSERRNTPEQQRRRAEEQQRLEQAEQQQRDVEQRDVEQRDTQQRAEQQRHQEEQRARDVAAQERRDAEQRDTQQRAEQQRHQEEQRARDVAALERRDAEQRDTQQRAEQQRRQEEKRAQDAAAQERRDTEQRDAQQRAERERRQEEKQQARQRAEQERRDAEQRDSQQRAERERRQEEEQQARQRSEQERRDGEQRDTQQRSE
jgi:hypothetical protein